MVNEENTPGGRPRTGLRALEVLLAIDEHGSITRAAEGLGLAQPTISAYLHRLERHLALPMVERTVRGSRLTEAGAAAARWGRDVLDASDRFEASVAALRQGASGKLALAASMTIAEYLAPAWLSSLEREQPDTAVSLQVCNSEDVMRLVLDGRADLGFIEGPHVYPRLRNRTVTHDELVFVVAESHPWARRKRPIEIDELLRARILVREQGSGTRETVERAVAAAGRDLSTTGPVLGSTAAIKTALSSGDFVGVMSALAVNAELRHGEFRQLTIEGLDLRRRLRMVWNAGRPLSDVADALTRIALRKQRKPSS
jgi:molybdate transport repressor ModE-like protein